MFLILPGVCFSNFKSKSLEGTFVGYGVESHTFRIFDKSSQIIIEPSGVVFEENDGSQVAQFHVSDVDVEIPQDAIRRMGMGFFHPIEGHLLADRCLQCYYP